MENIIIVSKYTTCDICGNDSYYKDSERCIQCGMEIDVAEFKCGLCNNIHKENNLEEDFSCPTPGCGDSIYWESQLVIK